MDSQSLDVGGKGWGRWFSGAMDSQSLDVGGRGGAGSLVVPWTVSYWIIPGCREFIVVVHLILALALASIRREESLNMGIHRCSWNCLRWHFLANEIQGGDGLLWSQEERELLQSECLVGRGYFLCCWVFYNCRGLYQK